jgi:hypothetical protein
MYFAVHHLRAGQPCYFLEALIRYRLHPLRERLNSPDDVGSAQTQALCGHFIGNCPQIVAKGLCALPQPRVRSHSVQQVPPQVGE